MRSNATSTSVLAGLGLVLAHGSGCIFLVDDAASGGGGAGAGAGAGQTAAVTGTGGAGTGASPPAGGGGFGGGGAGGEAACPIDVQALNAPDILAPLVDLAANSERIALAYEDGVARVYAAAIPITSTDPWTPAQLGGTPGVTARLAFDVGPGVNRRLYVVTPSKFLVFEDPTNLESFVSSPDLSLTGSPSRMVLVASQPAQLSPTPLPRASFLAVVGEAGLDVVNVIGADASMVVSLTERRQLQNSNLPYTDLASFDLHSSQFLAVPTTVNSALRVCFASNGCGGQADISTPLSSLHVRQRANNLEPLEGLVAYVDGGSNLVVASCDASVSPVSCSPVSSPPAGETVSSVGLAPSALLASSRVGTQQALHACCAVTADTVSTCNTLIDADVPAAPLVQIVPIGDSEFVARDSAHKLHRIRVGPN